MSLHAGEVGHASLRASVIQARCLLGADAPAEALELLVAALDGSNAGSDDEALLAEALGLAAEGHLALGNTSAAVDFSDEAVQHARALLAADETDDSRQRLHRSMLRISARAQQAAGEIELAANTYRQIIRTFRRVVVRGGSNDDLAELAHTLHDAAQCSLALDRVEGAIDLLAGAIRYWRPLCAIAGAPAAHRQELVECLRQLAEIEARRDGTREARVLMREVLALEAAAAPTSGERDAAALLAAGRITHRSGSGRHRSASARLVHMVRRKRHAGHRRR